MFSPFFLIRRCYLSQEVHPYILIVFELYWPSIPYSGKTPEVTRLWSGLALPKTLHLPKEKNHLTFNYNTLLPASIIKNCLWATIYYVFPRGLNTRSASACLASWRSRSVFIIKYYLNYQTSLLILIEDAHKMPTRKL